MTHVLSVIVKTIPYEAQPLEPVVVTDVGLHFQYHFCTIPNKTEALEKSNMVGHTRVDE